MQQSILVKVLSDNPVLIHMLGLCPIMAASNSIYNATILSAVTICVITFSAIIISSIRVLIPASAQIIVITVTIATSVAIAELVLGSWSYATYLELGLYLPLVTTNCIILARLKVVALRQPIVTAAIDAVVMGLGFALILLLLGCIRELLGFGTLFAATPWEIRLFNTPMLLFAVPVGTFWILAIFLIAHSWLRKRASTLPPPIIPTRIIS